MTNRVRNRARPTSTLLGGVCCSPIAVRRNESTMTMRVKEVTITRIDGATLSTVISITRRRICPDTVPPGWPRSTLIDWAQAAPARRAVNPPPAAATTSRRTPGLMGRSAPERSA